MTEPVTAEPKIITRATVELALELAEPMLKAGITYHQKTAHAAHALPGSRDRAGYAQEAADAAWALRGAACQDGAASALAVLAALQDPAVIDPTAAALAETRAALARLESAAKDMLRGVNIHNSLPTESSARSKDIDGPVIRELQAAAFNARKLLEAAVEAPA